jgi:hypothetical protein
MVRLFLRIIGKLLFKRSDSMDVSPSPAVVPGLQVVLCPIRPDRPKIKPKFGLNNKKNKKIQVLFKWVQSTQTRALKCFINNTINSTESQISPKLLVFTIKIFDKNLVICPLALIKP